MADDVHPQRDSESLPSTVLASDAERERSVLLLRDATVEGCLTLEEFSDRVGTAQLARTTGELQALTADLPAVAGGVAPVPAPPQATFTAACSRLERRGAWELPAHSRFRSFFGTIELDLRGARLAGSPTEIDLYNLFGTVTVIVPEGVRVTVEGGGWFASQVIEPSGTQPRADAPTLRIVLNGPGGTLYVRHREPPRHGWRRR